MKGLRINQIASGSKTISSAKQAVLQETNGVPWQSALVFFCFILLLPGCLIFQTREPKAATAEVTVPYQSPDRSDAPAYLYDPSLQPRFFISPYFSGPFPLDPPKISDPEDVYQMKSYEYRRNVERNINTDISGTESYERWYNNNNVEPRLFKND
jgi:hypothetical protein